MDVDTDTDIDGQLLQLFSSMGTTDKDVLIDQFQQLCENNPDPSVCAFFLDMTNWNLQAAIGAYFDYQHPSFTSKIPSMCLLKDATIAEGESFPPNTKFIKTWKIQNSGQDAWPLGCLLRFINGTQFTCQNQVIVSALQPGAVGEVSVEMTSPSNIGTFQGQWRMQTASGIPFGEMVWVIVKVAECGMIALTQKHSQVGCDDEDVAAADAAPHPLNTGSQQPNLSPVLNDTYPAPPAPYDLCLMEDRTEEDME